MDRPKGSSRHCHGAGYSIRAAAAEARIPYKTMQKAVELEQVKVVDFGGLKRVPASEVKRIKQLFADA